MKGASTKRGVGGGSEEAEAEGGVGGGGGTDFSFFFQLAAHGGAVLACLLGLRARVNEVVGRRDGGEGLNAWQHALFWRHAGRPRNVLRGRHWVRRMVVVVVVMMMIEKSH